MQERKGKPRAIGGRKATGLLKRGFTQIKSRLLRIIFPTKDGRVAEY